jgi:drug/metabolite transporter (DMT)-like permease
MMVTSLISAVVLFTVLKHAQSYLPKNWSEWQSFFILAALNQAVPFALSSWGQIYIEAGLASILLSVMPIFTVLLAAYFMKDEPLSWPKLFGAGLGFMGIIVLMGPAALKGLGVNFLAQLAVIVSALLYAFGAVYARVVYPLQPAALSSWTLRLRIMTAQFIASAVMLLPFSFALDAPWTLRLNWETWAYLIFLGVVVTLLATMIYYYLLERLGAGTASMTTYLIPVVGVIAGNLVLGERVSLLMVLALLLIFAGIVVTNRVNSVSGQRGST